MRPALASPWNRRWLLGLVAAAGLAAGGGWLLHGTMNGPPGSAPEGMVWIPPGKFWMGSADTFPDTKPVHEVYLDGFWMDQTEVTNAQFAEFVKATGYVTVAEKKPDAKDIPNAAPELLVPGSVVFTPPKEEVGLDNHLQWWSYVPGADWRHPEGPGSTIEGR